jgi:hypothetical protein
MMGPIEVQEELKVMYPTRAGHLLGIYSAFEGSMTSTVVDYRLILIAALRLGDYFVFNLSLLPDRQAPT